MDQWVQNLNKLNVIYNNLYRYYIDYLFEELVIEFEFEFVVVVVLIVEYYYQIEIQNNNYMIHVVLLLLLILLNTKYVHIVINEENVDLFV